MVPPAFRLESVIGTLHSITQEADPKRSASVFFWGGVRKVQEDNNGKLNPSHFVGPSRSQGHGRPWFIAILLIFKGIAIAFVGKFCYI